MRLNPDCIRDILLKTENGYFEFVFPNCRFSIKEYSDIKEFSNYSDDEIRYHLKYLKEANLIKSSTSACFIQVFDLTVSGHEFIANIRDNNNWIKTKEIANKVGSNSVSALIQIAANVISAVISKHLGL